MSSNSLPVKIIKVKIEFDKTNAREVYAAAQTVIPGIPPYELPIEVLKEHFIPAGADPQLWIKTLRNVEYNARQPKKGQRSQSRSTKVANRKHSPAQAVIWRDATIGVVS